MQLMNKWAQIDKKLIYSLIGIYLFFFTLNYLTPMYFGDDYVYAFIWPGQPMSIPLPDTAERVSCLSDILISQWKHYLTWGGRTPAHILVQFFVWQGKPLFNFINSLVSLILILEICWLSNRGDVSIDKLKAGHCVGIVLSLWALTPVFTDVFLWLSGTCNYLWMTVFLLGFLIPYVQKYYNFHQKVGYGYAFSFLMCFWGLLAGWGNENCVCWVVLIIGLFLFTHRNCRGNEPWLYVGLIGLMIGYLLTIMAPGNMVRLQTEFGSDFHNWLTLNAIQNNFRILGRIFTLQLIMWYFCLKALFKLKMSNAGNMVLKKDRLLAKITCLSAFGMSTIMIVSPFFAPRNGFPGTIYLVIASAILIRVQNELRIKFVSVATRKFLLGVGCLYFILTFLVTIRYSYEMKLQMCNFITSVKQARLTSPDTVFTVQVFKEPSPLIKSLSGYHLMYHSLAKEADSWGNVAVARYYGIKGVRMVRSLK